MTSTKPVGETLRQSPAVSPPSPEVRFAPRPWFLALVLVIVTFAAYQPSWHAGFIWDDDAHLTANPAMTAPHGLRMIWRSLAVGRYYPLTLTTFWVERRLWGLHPLPYHLVNVLFHAANGVVVYFLLRQLRIPAAWLAAMVWALHPVNVESVAWISELKNTQSGLFFFLSLLFFLKYAKEIQQRYRWYSGYVAGFWYAVAFVCGSAAVLSNASTAVLPLALLLAVRWQRGHWERADAVRIAPYVAVSWLVAGLAILGQYTYILRPGSAEWRLGHAERFVIAGKAVWFYVASILWPFRLAFVYPRWAVHAPSAWSWGPIAALVALGVVLWRCRGRAWSRGVSFAGGYFLAALLPVLGFFSLTFFRYSFVADRFQYLASVGIIALVCGAAATLWKRIGLSAEGLSAVAGVAKAEASWKGGLVRRSLGEGGYVTAVVVASLLTMLGILTWRQARIYRDPEALWRDTIAKNPQCWLAHGNLGHALLKEGKTSDAIGQYEQAVRIRPDYAEAQYGLGYISLQEGKASDAIEHYEQAARVMPALPQLQYNLAFALEQAGRIEEAIAHYEEALRLQPEYAEAHFNLANLLMQEGKTSDAIGHYEEAVRIQPSIPQVHYSLALALGQAGATDEASAHFEQALQIKPDYAEAHFNLGNVLLQEGKTSDAIEQYEQALRLDPGFAQAHYTLALALEQADRAEEAFAHFEQALWINPDLTQAQTALARLPSPR